MASLSSSTLPFPPAGNGRPAKKSAYIRAQTEPDPKTTSPSSSSSFDGAEKSSDSMIVTTDSRTRRVAIEVQKLKEKEAKERKEEVNRKIASKKAISVILRREATKAIIEKKRGPTNSKKLLPRTVLEALHERITALRWESALKVTPILIILLFEIIIYL